MGAKRPLEEEDFPEISLKQPKHLDNNIKLAFLTEDFLPYTTLRMDSPEGASIVDKELETSAPLSLVTSTSSGEDAGNEDTSYLCNFPGYFDYGIPLRLPEPFEDRYISLLNSSPKKEVPVGPDYQAEVPQWDPSFGEKDSSSSSNYFENEREQRLMGTCVIPMPELNDGVTVGRGRTDCICPDMGSMRCVQQHVKEAREKLRESIGNDKFLKLGFFDMGEEVASKWTPDTEEVFHKVIFSNPVSRGRDFWKHLLDVFPNRTMMEIVSYYFNVFMLRRRAVQNRSYFLQIDSDDDEEHCQNKSSLLDRDTDDEDDTRCDNTHGGFGFAGGEDEDSTVESFGDEDLDAGWVDDYGYGPDNVWGDEGSDNTHNQGEMDDGRGHISGQEAEKKNDDWSSDS